MSNKAMTAFPAENITMPRKKIVIVNDDRTYLELMQEFLREHNLEVTAFEEPDVTLARIKTQRPDLLIIDLIFGKEPNGWLILQHMRTDDHMHDIPVLMCSAAVEQMRARIDEFNGTRVTFLEKPFDLSVMLDTIIKLLSDD